MNELLKKCYRANESTPQSVNDLIAFMKSEHIKNALKYYLPAQGEGKNRATQAVTAMNKLIYKFINDGDMVKYDDHCNGNDEQLLNTYANWLFEYGASSTEIYVIMRKLNTFDEEKYAKVLLELAELVFSAKNLMGLATQSKHKSIYNETGPFKQSSSGNQDSETKRTSNGRIK